MFFRNYVKRQCMEADLRSIERIDLPRGVELLPWEPSLLEAHAEVLCESFHCTGDASLFPNLSCLAGCLYLMRTIVDHEGFVPEATWLARGPRGDLGSIQGVAASRAGMIQNLAVVPASRRCGVGRALLSACLQGFQHAGLKTVQLEVSVRNKQAVRLYHSIGFQTRKTFYREVQSKIAEYAS